MKAFSRGVRHLNMLFLGFFFMHFFCLYRWVKSIPVFRPKRLNNPFLWGGTYLYGYIGKYLPGHFSDGPSSKQTSVKKSNCFAMICITRQKLGQDTKYTATLGLFSRFMINRFLLTLMSACGTYN